MKNKITIRRKGCFLPTLALVVIFLLGSVLLWLSTVGLPQSALDTLTDRVQQETGLTLKVGKIRLSPTRGLGIAATDISLQEPGLPALQIEKLKLSFDWSHVATGRFDLPEIRLRGGVITLPVDEETGAALTLSNLHLKAALQSPQHNKQLHLNGSGNLQGIALSFTADFPLPEAEHEEPDTPLDLKKTISDIKEQIRNVQPELQQVHDEIARQHWETPPTVALQYHEGGERPFISVTAALPSYEWKDIHFHNARLQLTKDSSRILLKKLAFTTTAPDTAFEAKADFQPDTCSGTFDIASTASLVDIAQKHLQEEAPDWLKLIHHEPGITPHIRLRGDVRLTENLALEHLRVEGDIEQAAFTIGDSSIEALSAGFFYEDGNLHLDKLALTLPNGSALSLAAKLKDEHGAVDLQLNSDIDYLLHLINHFAEVSLPDDVKLSGQAALGLQLNLHTQPFIPGKTEWHAMVPEVKDITLRLKVDRAAVAGVGLDKPSLSLSAAGINLPFNKLPEGLINNLKLAAEADCVTYDKATVTHPALQASVCDMAFAQAGGDLKISLESATGELAVEHTDYDGAALHGFTLNAEAPYGWSTDTPAMQQLNGLHLRVGGKTLTQGEDLQAEHLSAEVSIAADNTTDITLTTLLNGQQLTLQLPFRLTETSLTCNNAHIICPTAELAPLLQTLGGETFTEITQQVQLPKEIDLRILKAEYDLVQERLKQATVILAVPELVRTPQLVPALRGQSVTIGVDTALELSQNRDGDYLYSGNLAVTHESGRLDAEVEGNTAASVHITGRNTIYADAIDRLIDNEDAHAIIRDFRFTPGRTTLAVDNIDTLVTYDNGTCVKVSCDASITEIDYLLDAFTEKEKNGQVREVYQDDVKEDSFTHFKQVQCGVLVDVLLDRKDKNGKPIPDVQTINLTHPLLTSDNRPYFKQQKLSGKGCRAETTITGDSVFIDIEENSLTLRGLKGETYPVYTLGTFFRPLREYLAGILLTEPAHLETKECVFPIALNSKVPTGGTIRINIPSGGRYNLQGTVIPIEQFSGFVTLSDDAAYLDRMNAATWGGVLNGQLNIGFSDKVPALDGCFTARAMDLRRIAKTFDADFKPAVCDADFRFRASKATLNALEGYGTANVSDGDLMEIPLFTPVAYVITHLPEFIADAATDSFDRMMGRKVNNDAPSVEPQQQEEEEKGWWSTVVGMFTHPVRTVSSAVNYSADAAANRADNLREDAAAYVPFANYIASYDLQDAHANFTIRNGFLYSDDLKVTGSNLKVKMELALQLADMTLNATLHPSFRSLLDAATFSFSDLSTHILDINVNGPLRDLSWSVRFSDKDAVKNQMKQDAASAQQPQH